MAKKYRHRKKKRSNPYLPFVAGLLFLGATIMMLGSGNANGNASGNAGQNSVSPLSVNFPAPSVSLESVNGTIESLADYRDYVVLVNNWATWCPPCKAEMPVLENFYEDHATEGLMIIAIEAGEPKDLVSQFVKDYRLQFQIWLDPHGESVKAFGNGNLPNSYVIDRSGTVRYAWTGEVSRPVLDQYVTPLLTEQ